MMSISSRAKFLAGSLCLSLVTAGAGLVTLNGERALRATTMRMYDDSFMSIDYFRAAEAKFAELQTLVLENGSVERARGDQISHAVIDNLDVAVERATSAAAKSQTVELRALVVSMLTDLDDDTGRIRKLKAGTYLFEHGAEQYAQDGFMFRLEAEHAAASAEFATETAIAGSVAAGVLVLLAMSRSLLWPYKRATRMAEALMSETSSNATPGRGASDSKVLISALSLVSNTLEVRERLHAEKVFASSHDSLTGTMNRTSLAKVMSGTTNISQTGQVGLLLVNISGLRRVNERFGQATGDVVLHEVASRLQHVSGTQDTVARTSGGEFAVFVRGCEPGYLATLASEIQTAIGAEIIVADQAVPVGVAMVHVTLRDGESPETLFCEAEAALHDARASDAQEVIAGGSVKASHLGGLLG